MIINHNISAMNAHRQLSANNNAVAKSLEKLSSGLRINRAGDDAAGLAISEKMRGQIRGLEMASKNAQDGISLIQTAEGALNETHAILQRMRELAVQAASDTNTDDDRAELQKEVDQLAAELTRIGNDTEFNTQELLNGTFTGTFHIGANSGQNISLTIGDLRTDSLNVGNAYTANGSGALIGENGTTVLATFVDDSANSGLVGYFTDDGSTVDEDNLLIAVDAAFAEGTKGAFGVDISSQTAADEAITTIQSAIDTVSAERSKLGAYQNRLEHTINNLGTSAENLQAAESRIRDVDYALTA